MRESKERTLLVLLEGAFRVKAKTFKPPSFTSIHNSRIQIEIRNASNQLQNDNGKSKETMKVSLIGAWVRLGVEGGGNLRDMGSVGEDMVGLGLGLGLGWGAG